MIILIIISNTESMFISILGTWDSVSELLIVGDVRLTSFWTGILEPLPLVGDIRYFPAIKRGNWTSPTNRVFFFLWENHPQTEDFRMPYIAMFCFPERNQFNIAIEHGPFIVDLPIKNGDFP